MTPDEAPCVCVFCKQPWEEWTRQNVGQGWGRPSHLGHGGPDSGGQGPGPALPHPRQESRAMILTCVAWRCWVGSYVTASPSKVCGLQGAPPGEQTGGRDPCPTKGENCKESSGSCVLTWDLSPTSFLQEIQFPQKTKNLKSSSPWKVMLVFGGVFLMLC